MSSSSPFDTPAPPVDPLALERSVRAFADAHKAMVAAGLSPLTDAGWDALMAVDWPSRWTPDDVTESSASPDAGALAKALVTLEDAAAPYIALMQYPALAFQQWIALKSLSDLEQAHLAFAIGTLIDPERIHRDDTAPLPAPALTLFNSVAFVLFVLIDARALDKARDHAIDKDANLPGTMFLSSCLGGGRNGVFTRLSRTVLRAWPGAPDGIAQGVYDAQAPRIDGAREVVERMLQEVDATYALKHFRNGFLTDVAEATKTLVPDMRVSAQATSVATRKSAAAQGLTNMPDKMIIFSSPKSMPVFRMLDLVVWILTWCSAARRAAIENGGIEAAATAILALREIIASNVDCGGTGAAALELWLRIEAQLRRICDGPSCQLTTSTEELRQCSRCQTAKYCTVACQRESVLVFVATLTTSRHWKKGHKPACEQHTRNATRPLPPDTWPRLD